MDNFLRDKKMKNIVLIGASNSRVPGGLQAGLDQDDVKFFNLSVGGTGSLYGVYAVNRYYSILEQADLIILENHMIDHILITDCDAEIDVIFRDIFWLYESISKFKKKVLILFLPETRSQSMFYEKIKHITLYLCNLYGFNFIDIYKYMKIRNILDFYLSYPNSNHQINTIMYNLGINISKNIKYLRNSKISSKYPIPNFSIWYPNTDQQFFNKDLIYREKVCIISDKKEYFPSEYADCVLLGIHTWTGGYYKELRNKKISKNLWNVYSYSSLKIQNCNQCIVKCFWTYNTFTNIYQRKFMVDSNTYFCFNKEQLPWSEKTLHLQKIEGL
ncbi:hypothetical protein MNG75_001554, partial [Campylobacter lari]|nr:hypothetical protein [Campylobacter lari]EIY6495417.1 hypothetical protein [Campylobacter lari]HEC1780340.1 hypothetical protein [Campylobacter lari]HEG5920493.1 hypothetical protein [Campylobacter lari]